MDEMTRSGEKKARERCWDGLIAVPEEREARTFDRRIFLKLRLTTGHETDDGRTVCTKMTVDDEVVKGSRPHGV
ncbi:hypothetical protein SCP_0208750 [Sparassis crispa]|uniref:Uncharacterized protein n=1 Tax=Sparassis crispa TaxID=139825 RepID=A0A401GBZ4_9APHY|nr:hypothetical protein SCP_0208750 [Sparassis crispa]GBE79675.1 hypothetical protein SCP_0208750 [Sparassis crispa]